MRIILLVILVVSNCLLHGQNRKFLIYVNQQEPLSYGEHHASGARLDLLELDAPAMSGMVLTKVNEELVRKSRKPVLEDAVLNKICYSGIQTFSKLRFKNRKSFNREMKNLDYALKLNHVENRMFVAYAFKVDLLDLDRREKFYHDRRPGTSDLALYKGNRPKTYSPDKEDFVEPEPLFAMTEEQMVDAVIEKMNKMGIMKSINSRKFTNFGMSLRIEKRSINRNKRPYMYVMIMLTGKQNYAIKKKDRLERLSEQDAAYE